MNKKFMLLTVLISACASGSDLERLGAPERLGSKVFNGPFPYGDSPRTSPRPSPDLSSTSESSASSSESASPAASWEVVSGSAAGKKPSPLLSRESTMAYFDPLSRKFMAEQAAFSNNPHNYILQRASKPAALLQEATEGQCSSKDAVERAMLTLAKPVIKRFALSVESWKPGKRYMAEEFDDIPLQDQIKAAELAGNDPEKLDKALPAAMVAFAKSFTASHQHGRSLLGDRKEKKS